jgi:hypothetical protein
MKSTLITLLFLLGAYSIAVAQNIDPLWVRHEIADGSTLYGSPFVMVDPSHNTFVCSNDYHPGPLNSFLTTKYDADGNLLWKRKYDSFGQDEVISTIVDGAGSIYVGGNTTQDLIGGTLPRFIVIKYASNGDSLWNYRFDGLGIGSNYITKLLLDSVQNLMVFGQYGDSVANRGGLFVAKVSSEGQELWRATYLDSIYGIGGTDVRWVGNRWIFWGRNNDGNGYRYFSWQVDNHGQSMGTAFTEFDPELFNVQYIDKLGNLFVGGDRKYKVTKYSPLGQKNWTYEKPLMPSASFVPARLSCIESNAASEVFISGFIRVDSIGLQPLTTKLDASGNMVWDHSVLFNGINEGQLLIAGISLTKLNGNYNSDFFLTVYDDQGFVQGGISDLEGMGNAPTP